VDLHARLAKSAQFLVAFEPELDIVVWSPRAASASRASQLARAVFDECARRGLHLALAELPAAFFDTKSAGMAVDRETITCLRSVLMKPEHREWVARIHGILEDAARAVTRA
jgi:hypothetical protein